MISKPSTLILSLILSYPVACLGGWSEPVLVDSTVDVPHPEIETRNDSIVVIYEDEFIRSVDGGQTWRDNYFIDHGFWYGNRLKLEGDTLTAFFGTNYPMAWMWLNYSDDFGETWQGPRNTPGYPSGTTMDCARHVEMLYQCAVVPQIDGGLMLFSKSLDFGVNWSPPESIFFFDTGAYPLIYKFFDRLFIISEVDYMYSHFSTIQLLYSTNEGQSWASLDSLTPLGSNWLVNLDASNNGMMAFVYNDWWTENPDDSSRVYVCVSSDSGQSWTPPIDLSCAQQNTQPRVSITGDTVAASFHGGRGFVVRRSCDLGQTWGEPEVLDSLAGEGDIEWDNGKIHAVYIALYQGVRALFYRCWEPDTVSVDDNPLPEFEITLSAYPNPFNSSTAISYSLAAAGHVTLAIYNITGQKVATLFSGVQQAGEHKMVWDAAGVPSGVYFARLESGGGCRSVKMVLLR